MLREFASERRKGKGGRCSKRRPGPWWRREAGPDLPSEFCRDAAPLMRKAWRARLRSPKLQLLGTLLGLSSRLWSALGERRTLWACGDPFPLAATPRGLEKTRSFKLTFWLLPRGPTGGRTHTERQRERSPWQERSPHRPLAADAYSWVGSRETAGAPPAGALGGPSHRARCPGGRQGPATPPGRDSLPGTSRGPALGPLPRGLRG